MADFVFALVNPCDGLGLFPISKFRCFQAHLYVLIHLNHGQCMLCIAFLLLVCLHTCVSGGQRSSSNTLHLGFETVSHWTGAHRFIGWPVSFKNSMELEFQVHTSTSGTYVAPGSQLRPFCLRGHHFAPWTLYIEYFQPDISCLLRRPARALQIQTRMFEANHSLYPVQGSQWRS